MSMLTKWLVVVVAALPLKEAVLLQAEGVDNKPGDPRSISTWMSRSDNDSSSDTKIVAGGGRRKECRKDGAQQSVFSWSDHQSVSDSIDSDSTFSFSTVKQMKEVLDEDFSEDLPDDHISKEVKKFMALENKADSDALIIASEIGRVYDVRQLLRFEEIDVNKYDANNLTALYAACTSGHELVVQLLLDDPRVDVNQGSRSSALFIASEQGNAAVVARLLRHPRIDVNKSHDQGWTALIVASQYGMSLVAQELLRHPRINVNHAGTEFGATALTIASQNGNEAIVTQLLVRPDVMVNQTTLDGSTALFEACQNGRVRIVEHLLQHRDIAVNQALHDGRTPLFIASAKGHSSVVSLLLRYPGIELNRTDRQGWSALYIACANKHPEVVLQLLDQSEINVNQGTNQGVTPLFVACRKGASEIVRYLLNHPSIDVNKAAPDGAHSVFFSWGKYQSRLRVTHLPRAGNGVTPLYVATQFAGVDVVQQLLSHPNTNVNHAHYDGVTVLTWAAEFGRLDLVEMLLAHPKINVNQIAYRDQKLPTKWKHLKKERDHLRFKNLFYVKPKSSSLYKKINLLNAEIRKIMDQIRAEEQHGVTALLLACQKGNVDVARALLAHPDTNVNQTLVDGSTALMKAAANDHLQIVTNLLQHPDINLNKTDDDGWTALMTAVVKGNIRIVQQFLSQPSIDVSAKDRTYGLTAYTFACIIPRAAAAVEMFHRHLSAQVGRELLKLN